MPLSSPSLRVWLLHRGGGGEQGQGPPRDSVPFPLPPSSFGSHCVRMSSALPRARCRQRWPGWKISPWLLRWELGQPERWERWEPGWHSRHRAGDSEGAWLLPLSQG